MKRLITALAAFALALTVGTAPAGASTEGWSWPHARYHWANVSVEDHTGALWDVSRAVAIWGSGLYYRPCKPGTPCVRVYERAMGANGLDGYSVLGFSGRAMVNVTVYVNDSYNSTDAVRRLSTLLHELGHALGLGHDDYADVMYPANYGYLTISRYERWELWEIYLR